MRFARQARIFRGHLDPAAFASVVFLLVMFLQLGSMLSTPGVLIQLPGAAGSAKSAATITVADDGRIHFGTNVFSGQNLEDLRPLLKNSTDGPPFYLVAEPGAPGPLVQELQKLFGLELPDGPPGLIGSANPRVIVAVNFLGQYFYQNRLIGEIELRNQLKQSLQTASLHGKELDLVISADKKADFNAVSRLQGIASEVGIKHAYEVERTEAMPSGQPKPGS